MLSGRFAAFMPISVVLLSFTLLIGIGAIRHSPTFDEPAHFASGWSHWELGRFDLYQVNPPLVRMVATIPSRIMGKRLLLGSYAAGPRPEFAAGREFLEVNPVWALTFARWACVPFGLLGAWVCYQWSTDLYGSRSGLLAVAIWCFSPTVLAHAQLITPDLGAAAMGIAAAYLYWRWLAAPGWGRCVCAGFVLGLAALTKSTLIFLFPLWPLLWIVYRTPWGCMFRREGLRLSCLLLVALFVVHAGYGFEGSFKPLKDHHFVSRTLGGDEQFFDVKTTGNRFSDHWLGVVPVPLPRSYLLGMDMQRRELEERKWSYLHGEWRLGGWWYYYLHALMVKEPLGLFGLAGMALMRRPKIPCRDELVVVCPMLFLFAFVSSQTGFNHHYRYVLPALPFFFILVSGVVAKPPSDTTDSRRRLLRSSIVGVLIGWFVFSSLFVYPHSLSYFNEIAGGPLGGPKHLLGSSTDWGQDLYYLREWLDEHPDVDDFSLAWTATLIDPALVDIHAVRPPSLVQWQANLEHSPARQRAERRWYLLSVNELYDNSDRYSYFREIAPTTTVAYTIYVYHVSWDDIQKSMETSRRE